MQAVSAERDFTYPSFPPLVCFIVLPVSPFSFRMYPIKEVPVEAEALTDWLYQRFVEKEELLAHFYDTGLSNWNINIFHIHFLVCSSKKNRIFQSEVSRITTSRLLVVKTLCCGLMWWKKNKASSQGDAETKRQVVNPRVLQSKQGVISDAAGASGQRFLWLCLTNIWVAGVARRHAVIVRSTLLTGACCCPVNDNKSRRLCRRTVNDLITVSPLSFLQLVESGLGRRTPPRFSHVTAVLSLF